VTTVYTGASMSLDGYIAGPGDTGFEHLFKWYGNGDVEVPTTHPDMTLRMTVRHGRDRAGDRGGQGAVTHLRYR
jgi:hypothetical protein